MTKHYCVAIVCVYLAIFFICGLAGCDRLGGSRYAQLMQDADSKSANGDFARAINLYEAALDDSPRCAEIHYKLALLYDDKLNDPVSALHHFKRYLALSPNGPHANEVERSIKHDEIAALNQESKTAPEIHHVREIVQTPVPRHVIVRGVREDIVGV